ncbi:apses-domain-containing protein [Tothia fuscella]|uniref:Apses-domain-containing protein n=1 Tax=Tothia fuscella TaxID=1048955 RepID=A0A9P4TUF6_9PEZI|nr:apses-domain-containing protein [Tothia fuscella]
MRRRADDYINATHILKAAAYDKPARTRILEREVQKGLHEKVQGGYGKYQGTWIPLPAGRALAERNGVLEKLLAIFDFVPGDRSPPPAPKHATAASNRPRVPRQPAAGRRMAQPASQLSEDRYDVASVGQYAEEETPDNVTVISDMMDDDPYSQYGNSKKRKRGVDQMSQQDQMHQIWADQLLDYFMLLESEDSLPGPPEPPPGVDLDRPIDEKGHSALHWAAAMGDIEVVKTLIASGARIDCLSNNLDTPLMRAVMFTNNFDKQTMAKLVRILSPTVARTDWFGSTVFHHIAATTSSKNKYLSARYYMDTIINVLSETWIPESITQLLDMQDKDGDTAVMIAARYGARKCVRALLARNVQVGIPNIAGETADELVHELNARRRTHQAGRASSSPFPSESRAINGDKSHPINGGGGGPVLIPPPQFQSQTANALMTRNVPNIIERCKALAQAYETEFEVKTEEEREIEQVMQNRYRECESLKRVLADLEPQLHLLNSIPEDVNLAEEEELRQLEAEALALIEMDNLEDLRKNIRQSMVNGTTSTSNGVVNNLDSRALAQKISIAMAERQRLVRDIVAGMGSAGLGEKQEGYKRLIRGAIGVKEDEIEGMLDEVLNELEEEVRERNAMKEG